MRELAIGEEFLDQYKGVPPDDVPDHVRVWPETHKERLNTVIEYGNAISRMMYEGFPSADQSRGRLVFVNTRKQRPNGHPTSREAAPDITVFFEGSHDKHGVTPYWSQLESLSEVYTSGKDLPEPMERSDIAHTGYFLEARPDRICIVTIHVGKRGISFLTTDATGCRRTPVIEDWSTLHTLFIAYVHRLYSPPSNWMDPTIERAGPSDEHDGAFLFYVNLAKAPDPEIRPRYRIMHVGDPFHRRSIVFRNVDHPVTIDGQQVDIIKEQYIPSDRRFQETEVIDHIHQDGTVPGVVEMICHEDVALEDGKPIELTFVVGQRVTRRRFKKVRIAQCDMGIPLANVSTLWDFLIGVYDLLEILRVLYKLATSQKTKSRHDHECNG